MCGLKYDQEVFGQRHALAGSLSPMLKMMRTWGLYFGRYGRTWTRIHSQETQLQAVEQYKGAKNGMKHQSIYPTVVLSIVWANVLKFCLAIEVGDTFDSPTIRKIAFGVMQLQCAVMQTSYYIASRKGKLDQILDELNVTEKYAALLYKQSIACLVFNSFIAILFVGNGVFGLFLSNGEFDFATSPFTTLIPVDGIWLNVVRVLSFILYLFVMQSWVWSFVMNLMLTAILFLLFRQLNRRFRRALSRRGQFNGNLKTFRSRHQALSSQQVLQC